MPNYASQIDASWVDARQYSGGHGRADGDFGLGDNHQASISGIYSSEFGNGTVRNRPVARAEGFDSYQSSETWVLYSTDYPRQQYVVNASWEGAELYAPPAGFVIGSRSAQIELVIQGIEAPVLPEPKVFVQQLIKPQGSDYLETGIDVYVLHPWEYAPPLWFVNGIWVGKDEYTPPHARITNGAWSLPSESKQITLTGWESHRFGASTAYHWLTIVEPEGFDAHEASKPTIENTGAGVYPTGIPSPTISLHYAWNWRQYVVGRGSRMDLHGDHYVSGGVKEVLQRGFDSLRTGSVLVVNTRADQTARPATIPAPPVGKPDVSPRTLWPSAIYGTGFGFPLIQFPPQPAGWLSSAFGYPAVEDKTKYPYVPGIDSYATGYAIVRDRAQRIYHHASAVTTVFGDIHLRITTQYVSAEGHDSLETGGWSEVRSNRRWLYAGGFTHTDYGHTGIRNKTPSLAPPGWDSFSCGDHLVAWSVREVLPSGVPVAFQQVPLPSLWQTPSLSPRGIDAPQIDRPTVWPAIRTLFQSGSDMAKFGVATLDFSWRRVVLENRGVEGSSYGETVVTHWTRRVYPLGRTWLGFGDAWLTHGVRFLDPVSIPEVPMSRHKIGGTQHVGPEGWDSVRWLTRIIPESREILPKPFGASYGWPTVHHYTTFLHPEGIVTYPEPFMHWGVGKVWNLRQYIIQDEAEESQLRPPSWPQWTLIENRNKVIGGIGFVAGRYGNSHLENNARVIGPSGIEYPWLPEWQKTGSVTHRQRWYRLDGIEPHYISTWSVIYNKAVPVKPAGYVASLFGTTEVINLRRSYRIEGWDSGILGYPFIAYAIRELTFETRYSIRPPNIQLPDVRLHTRYVEPPSIATDQSKHGLPIVITRFNRIITRWSHRDLFGNDVRVRNLTPEIGTHGRAADEFGQSFVRLEWRPVYAEGSSMQLFGRQRIADRRQVISAPGRNFMVVSDRVGVRRIGQDPVVTQYIDLRIFGYTSDGDPFEADYGYGIEPPTNQVGAPNLMKGYIYHNSSNNLGDMLGIGTPYITANTIRVEPGYGELLVSEPFVSLKNRVLEIVSITDSEFELGKPRVSPHTIYAVLEAPDQAVKNHDMSRARLRPVNAGARFGHPSLTLYRGLVFPAPIHHPSPYGNAGVGRPSLYSTRQYISHKGSNMMRFGWAVIPGDQSVVVEDSIENLGFGRAEVGRPPYVGPRTVSPRSILAPSIPSPLIEFFHRSLRPVGTLMQSMGASGYGSTLHMPQNLHVGPRVPTIAEGFDAGGYGTQWVSHAVRDVVAEGFETFASEYDYTRFDMRMRVWLAEQEELERIRVGATGEIATEWGAAGVRHGTYFIRPDGNAETYRKGAGHG